MRTLIYLYSLLFLFFTTHAHAEKQAAEAEEWADLEELFEPSLVDMIQIKIPDHPEAFNPSLVAWGRGGADRWLLSFREIEQADKFLLSHLYFVKLNQDFQPISSPQRIDAFCRSPADARLLQCGDALYCVYSHKEPSTKENSFVWRLWLAEVYEEAEAFTLRFPTPLTEFPGMHHAKDEKNWAPFSYNDQLLLAYTLKPHRILLARLGSQTCTDFSLHQTGSKWKWGGLRGGTPALLIEGRYVAFFHSAKWMHSKQSEGRRSYHYFMGAYTFSPKPPFAILEMSPLPIVGLGFYSGPIYIPHWKKPIQAIFPSGLAELGPYLLVSYGRQDHEMWIAKFDKRLLLDSLKPLKNYP